MEEQINMSNDINEVLQILRKINIDIKIPSNASSSDKGLHNLMIEGTKENDYKKIYSFVQSVEMGCGFYSSETAKLMKMYDIAIKENQDIVIEIFNDKNKLIDIVYNCYCIQKEFKFRLLQSPELTNGLVIFELIRQVMNEIQLQELNNNYLGHKMLIGNAIVRLASIDSTLFKYFIEKFEYKEQFYHIMGIALSYMATVEREIYAKSITLSKQDDTYFEYVKILLQNIEEDKFDFFITDIKEIICYRWNSYLESLLRNKEFVSNIIINSYGDLILNCFCNRYKDEELFFEDLEDVITQFNKAIYKWYGKETEFSSMYYVYATKLLFLKKVQEINKISLTNRGHIYYQMIDLFDNNRILHNRYIKIEDLVIE